jgi:hypothetical protein
VLLAPPVETALVPPLGPPVGCVRAPVYTISSGLDFRQDPSDAITDAITHHPNDSQSFGFVRGRVSFTAMRGPG